MQDSQSESGAFLRVIFSAAPVQLGGLRRRLREWLVPLGLEGADQDDVILAVNEAASNCVDHDDERPAAVLTTTSMKASASPSGYIAQHSGTVECQSRKASLS